MEWRAAIRYVGAGPAPLRRRADPLKLLREGFGTVIRIDVPYARAASIRRAIALATLLALVACSHVPKLAMPGSGSDQTRGLVVDRVWIDTDAEAPRGSLRAFLSDGTLVMTSCVEVYRLAPWRWIDGSRLVWEEDGRSIKAEVVLAGRDELVLAIALDEETLTKRFSAAQAPVVCPDLRQP
jgi:hypothetical protein